MKPASESDIPVRVKNSYNPKAPGTIITRKRDLSKVSNSIETLDYLTFRMEFSYLLNLECLYNSIYPLINVSFLLYPSGCAD